MKHRLKAFTETTGGHTYFQTTLERCRETMRQIVQEVSEHYTIGYYPTNANHDGSWHKVKVAIRKADQDKMRYNVRTRSGYYSPLPLVIQHLGLRGGAFGRLYTLFRRRSRGLTH